MDGIDEDDGYSDDDLDDLPVQDFHELQQDAIRTTQQPRPLRQIQSPYANRGKTITSRLGGLDKLSTPSNGGVNSFSGQPSSDYGDFDEEMLEGQIFDAGEEPSILQDASHTLKPVGESTQREQWRQQRYGSVLPNASYQKPSPLAVRHDNLHGPEEYSAREPGSSPLLQRSGNALKPIERSSDAEGLQAKIDEV